MARQPLWAYGSENVEVSGSHSVRHTSLGRTPLDEWSTRRRDNTQHSQESDIHAQGGIRTHNSSKRAAADPHLTPCDRRDVQIKIIRALTKKLWQ